MEKLPRVYETRIVRILKRLEQKLYGPSHPVEIGAFEPAGEPVPAEDAFGAEYRPFQVGEAWGAPWNTVWFRIRGTIPAEWAGRRVAARIAFSPWDAGEGFLAEGMVWEKGKPRRAININRQDVPLAAEAKGGETFEFFVEAAANQRANMAGGPKFMAGPEPEGAPIYKLERAEIACFNQEAWEVFHDLTACSEAMLVLPENSQRRGQLLHALNDAVNALDLEDLATFSAASGCLRPLMARKNSETVHHVSAIGHAHIDTAWLWPLRETMRKCARTFSTALRYMEEYPDYIFGCSQAVQYAWMKEQYPDIYADIKAAVKRGQWEPIGSMWVEVDCNIPSGESLIRQILLGKKFFMEEFGFETTDVWIPDVFGYCASMPQIMKLAGIRYFLTNKISWNQVNKFPHHTFLWEGIDGTQIFSHFPPTDTYNGNMSAREVISSTLNFKENDRASRSLYPYGFGDGGGGPTRPMLELAKRYRDFEGIPKVELEKVSDFFPKAEADAKDLPVWSGELYLELHRGTYTTQAKNKRWNRKCEFLLREAEFFDAVSLGLLQRRPEPGAMPPHAVYDVVSRDASGVAAVLDRAWKLLLLNQFHDIIPGSSINWVYEDSTRDYQTIATLGSSIVEPALKDLVASISTEKFQKPLVVHNTLSHSRREVVSDPAGGPVWAEAPACGYAVVETKATLPEGVRPVQVRKTDGGHEIDNGLLRLRIDRDGLLERVYDLRAKREVLVEGSRGNLFQLHSDIPNFWEAWDVDIFYRETGRDLTAVESVKISEENDLRVTIAMVRKFGKSEIRQNLIVRAGSPRIDFETEVDWHEEEKFLKVAFPVEVRSPRATYEIQFGHTERPTHQNTSWDLARFEVCAQKWADLSEGDYGVALLNDCKYGHDIIGNVMRLSLLRAPIAPDPVADRGRHNFTYSLLPHVGDFREGLVIEEAYALNVPLRVQPTDSHGGSLPSARSFFEIDRPGLVVESVKVAEDGTGVILRCYEAYGTRGPARIRAHAAKKAAIVDLMERETAPLEMAEGAVNIEVKPFEIVTLKFSL